MSARDVMAAMLDELMGPKRNVELGKDTKVTFDDPNICPYYLVGLCPHEMFTNTKADLGACNLVHDDNLRRMYPESPECGKLGFERKLLRFLIQLDEDNMRRIRKNREKLAGMDDQGKRKQDEERNKLTKEIEIIDNQLKDIMRDAEAAGNEGNVSRCQQLVSQSEEMGAEKIALADKLQKLNEQTTQLAPMLDEMTVKPMEVCEVCGSMLIVNDAQQRVEEHLLGKMHTGFQRIRNMIGEIKERLTKYDEQDVSKRDDWRKERRDGGERRRSGSRDRGDRDRRKRSRSRSPYRGGGRDRRDKRDDRRYDNHRDRDRGNRSQRDSRRY